MEFFSTFKTEVRDFIKQVTGAFSTLQTRLTTIETKLETLFKDKVDATPVQEAAPKAENTDAK